jgi:hypothetical protein
MVHTQGNRRQSALADGASATNTSRKCSATASQLLLLKIVVAKGATEEGRGRQRRTKPTRERAVRAVIEIEFAGGHRVQMHGAVDAATLRK